MPRREGKSVIRTGYEIFADGSALELIRISNNELGLVSWNGTSAETAQQFVRQGKTFAPLEIDPTALRFLRLPESVADHGSTRKLFGDVAAFVSRATQEADDVVQMLTFFVFATWLGDRAPSAPPFLWIITPPTTTWAPLAQVLSILCRRALFVNHLSPLGLRSLPTGLGSTLLTEMVSPTKKDMGLLRMSTRHGALLAPGGQFVDLCRSQVVFSPEPLRDPPGAGFPLEIVLSPARNYIPLMSAAELESVATEFQCKFLHYRFVNLMKVHAPAFGLDQFTAPMRGLACSLGACIVNDDDLGGATRSLDRASRWRSPDRTLVIIDSYLPRGSSCSMPHRHGEIFPGYRSDRRHKHDPEISWRTRSLA